MSLHKQNHPEYVEGCFGCKVTTLVVGYCGKGDQDATSQKKWDRELDLYADTVKSGIQPESTKTPAILAAQNWSEKTGVAYSEENKMKYDHDKTLERYAI